MSAYTYPSNYVFQSDNSFIVKRNVTFKDCVPTPPAGSCDLFNATRCGNDECYAQPFVSEILYFQWRFAMPLSMSLSFAVSLVDEDFNAISYSVPLTSYGLGYDAKLQVYQWLNIDTSLIPANVDYFHVKVVYGGSSLLWYSEPFERVACDEPTVVISADAIGKDCFNNFHKTLPNYSGTDNGYASQIRIYGTLEKVGHSITKETTEEVEVSTTIEQIFSLRTSRKVPQYVADKLAECFSGSTLFIDGIIYTGGSSIDKDFEEGKMWIISTELKQTCVKDNFACN